MSENKTPSLENLKAGTECWAWQYDWPGGLKRPLSSMKPARGVLAECPDRIGDTTRGPGWFVPYSGKSRRPAFTKAVRVEAVNLAADQEAAEDGYNGNVRKAAARFLDLAAMAQQDIVRTERDGFAHGELEDYPVMRADLSMDFSGIATAAEPVLEPNPDFHGAMRLSWEEFTRMEQNGCINRYDGTASFQLDGKGCNNALVDMWRGQIYIPDKYAVPFSRVPEVFKGREVTVLWFNK